MKARTVAVVVLALALGYPASSWFLGYRVHSNLDAQYQKLADNPFIQLRERKVDMGVFESVETTTFELMPVFMNAMNGAMRTKAAAQARANDAEGEAAAVPAPIEPWRFTTRTVIKHGPFPGLAGFGAAQAHTEFVFGNPANPVIAKLYGDKAPLTVDTEFGFGGGGHQVALSPAVETIMEDQTKVSWGEIRLEVDFTRDLASYTMAGGLPSFRAESGDASHVAVLSALAIDAKQKRLFDDDASTYIGPVSLTLESMDIASTQGASFRAEKLRVASDVVAKGEYLDMTASYGAQALKFGPESVGPGQIDIGIRHVNARALSNINKEYMKLIQSGKVFDPGVQPDMSMFKPMAGPLQTILEGSPELAIDKLEVGFAQGKVAGQVVVRLPNAKIGDPAVAAENPLVLMGLVSALEVEGNLTVPEALALSAVGEQKAAMLPAMVEQGYLVQQNGAFSTTFKYATGQLAVNGKKVNMGLPGASAPRQQ